MCDGSAKEASLEAWRALRAKPAPPGYAAGEPRRPEVQGRERFAQMAHRKLFASLPNLITLARLLLAPLAVLMIVSQRFPEAFAVFLVAGASDAVDGFIAKRFDLRTELGAYLDPLADKALLVSIYVTLAVVGELPAAIAIIVVSRDLMILIAVLTAWHGWAGAAF